MIKATFNLNYVLKKPCKKLLYLVFALKTLNLIGLIFIKINFYTSSQMFNIADYRIKSKSFGQTEKPYNITDFY